MASYILGVLTKQDMDKYGLYMAEGFKSIQGFDVEVAVSDQFDTLEGTAPGTSIVLMKFKNDDEAMRWYRSGTYQAAIPLRHEATKTAFMVHFKAN